MADAVLATSSWMLWTRATMSCVACEVCPASCFTSFATTAKPLPTSPARAASMVALSASRFVCATIAWMRSTPVLISWEKEASRLSVSFADDPIRTALAATSAAWLALPAISWTAVPICSVPALTDCTSPDTPRTESVMARLRVSDSRAVSARSVDTSDRSADAPFRCSTSVEITCSRACRWSRAASVARPTSPNSSRPVGRGTARRSPSRMALTPRTVRAASRRVRHTTPAASQPARPRPSAVASSVRVRCCTRRSSRAASRPSMAEVSGSTACATAPPNAVTWAESAGPGRSNDLVRLPAIAFRAATLAPTGWSLPSRPGIAVDFTAVEMSPATAVATDETVPPRRDGPRLGGLEGAPRSPVTGSRRGGLGDRLETLRHLEDLRVHDVERVEIRVQNELGGVPDLADQGGQGGSGDGTAVRGPGRRILRGSLHGLHRVGRLQFGVGADGRHQTTQVDLLALEGDRKGGQGRTDDDQASTLGRREGDLTADDGRERPGREQCGREQEHDEHHQPGAGA